MKVTKTVLKFFQTLNMCVLFPAVVLDSCGDIPGNVGKGFLCVHVHCCEPDWKALYVIIEILTVRICVNTDFRV